MLKIHNGEKKKRDHTGEGQKKKNHMPERPTPEGDEEPQAENCLFPKEPKSDQVKEWPHSREANPLRGRKTPG